MKFFSSVIALSLAASACAQHTTSLTPARANDEPVRSVVATRPVSALVARFDAARGELPEGFVLGHDAAYVGFAPTSRVVRVDIVTGAVSPFGQLPAPVAGKGFMTGLAESQTGDVYAGLASFVPEVQAGIYRISKTGGSAELFAKDAALPFPNALAFDRDGALFATDSGTGSIFRVDSRGQATRWATGEALTGDKDSCDGRGPGFAVGANGLVVENDAVYVVNMDKATLLKVPRDAAGNAGVPVILAGPDCAALGGADGLTRAPDGSFVVAVNRQNKIVRITRTGAIHTVAEGNAFDFPATLAYRDGTLYATNFALKNASAGKPATPGLVRVAE